MRVFNLKWTWLSIDVGAFQCKKMIKRMCNAYYSTFTEMSAMYDDFATAEEDDSWKSWVTSDEYLDVLTLRSMC